MVYKLILGVICIVLALFAYRGDVLTDPTRTLTAAVFLGLAAAVFLDTEDEVITDE